MANLIKCPKCVNYTSQKSSNVVRHLQVVHKATNDDVEEFKKLLIASRAFDKHGGGAWECEICKVSVATKKTLESHMTRKHPKKPLDPSLITLSSSPPLKSPPAKKIQLQKIDESSILIERVATAPQKPQTSEGTEGRGNVACPKEECSAKFNSRQHMAQHFCSSHAPDSEIESHVFDTDSEYRDWVNMTEEETCTGWKVRNAYEAGDVKVSYRVCRHEGHYKSIAKDRQMGSSKKKTGESKCPAFLKTEKNEISGKISVTGYFEHHGHLQEHALRKLSNEEICHLIRLMKDGFSNSQIIKKCDAFDMSSRLAYLVPDDLRNIRASNNLYEGRFHENDLESLKMRVDRAWPEDGIMKYSAPDEKGAGFTLIIMTPAQQEICEKYSHRGICIDDTHNPTKYPLKLTTMLVLNGQDRGIPVAFMLSSSVTSEDVAELFECVKRQIPLFNPQFLMSDESAAFWNAYIKVFPNNPTRRLWCRWHVLRALERNADDMLGKKDAATVKATLSDVIREPDRISFDRKISSMLQFLENSGHGGEKYAEYFRSYYIDKTEIWATCHRRGAPFHTSMFSENWHSGLKKNLLNRNTNIRIDELVQVLFDGFTWVVRRIAKQVGRQLKKSSARRSQNLKNCKLASTQLDKYSINRNEDGQFEVEKRGTDDVYIVKDSLGCQCFADVRFSLKRLMLLFLRNFRKIVTVTVERALIDSLVHVCINCQALLANIFTSQSDTTDPFDSPIPDDFDIAPFQNLQLPPVDQSFHLPSSLELSKCRAEKIIDDFNREIEALSQKMRVLKRKPENIEKMNQILELVKEANELIPETTNSTLSVRRDASKKPLRQIDINIARSERPIDRSFCLLQTACHKYDVSLPKAIKTKSFHNYIFIETTHIPLLVWYFDSDTSETRRLHVIENNMFLFLEFFVVTTKRKKASKRNNAFPSGTPLKVDKDPAICNVCHKVDPPLNSDIDDEEVDCQVTEWRRCSNEKCKLPVHFLCSNSTCPSCQGTFERYVPSSSSGSSDDSSSDSEIDFSALQ
ncbi:hypothetical protein CRE_02568 [Caenorhabditis remanei]|uniref:C2H2-type domain-containing protein n=1 Tax=Caenorhabditis remanei TaxID=31234 RepID=E3N4V2_CAERE|nr:hypothetical protein CRE_02568 [Caenorhabditis remanei]